jgi:hypothetical protein
MRDILLMINLDVSNSECITFKGLFGEISASPISSNKITEIIFFLFSSLLLMLSSFIYSLFSSLLFPSFFLFLFPSLLFLLLNKIYNNYF